MSEASSCESPSNQESQTCAVDVMKKSSLSDASHHSTKDLPTTTAEPSYNENHHVSAHFHIVPPQGNAFDGGMNPFDALHEKDVDEASVGADGAGKQILPMANMHGNPVRFPGEREQQKMAFLRNLDVNSQKDAPRSVIVAAFESFKYLYSSVLLILSVVMLMAALFSEQTLATTEKDLSPILAFFIFWAMIAWLAMMEGGQGCLVGLQPVEKALYAETHPKTFDNTHLCHRGNNMGRFIVGRQVSRLVSSCHVPIPVYIPSSAQLNNFC
jgi:hypothetical protein